LICFIVLKILLIVHEYYFSYRKFYEILYIIPLISIGFDIYILTEDFKIKRIGEFLKNKSDSDFIEWENWVSKYKNPYATFGAPLFTMISLLGAGFLLIKNISCCDTECIFFIIWFLILLIIEKFLWKISGKTRRTFNLGLTDYLDLKRGKAKK
jgi:hypothetical protein